MGQLWAVQRNTWMGNSEQDGKKHFTPCVTKLWSSHLQEDGRWGRFAEAKSIHKHNDSVLATCSFQAWHLWVPVSGDQLQGSAVPWFPLGCFQQIWLGSENKSDGCDEPLTWCSKRCYVLVLDCSMGYPRMGMTWEQAMLLQWGREMHSLCAQRCPNFLLFCTLGRLILCQLSLAVHTFHSLNCFCFRPSFTLLFT